MRIIKSIKEYIKRKRCNHQYVTITNLHGDAINFYNGSRSISKCSDCGIIRFNNYLDSKCSNVNKF